MSERKIENAVIASTSLGIKWTDHGILSFGLHLEGSGWGQTFGHLVMDTPVKDPETGAHLGRVGTAFGCECIRRICELFGEDWEGLPGTPCRVDHDFGKVYRVGHYVRDEWFDPDDISSLASASANDG